jgi:ribosomal protein S18 acetylase RimI-like enzyme
MNVVLRTSQPSDFPFLRRILYEAVFWRASPDKPSLEEGLAYPEVRKSLADWGERDGDVAVVATVNSVPAGACWYRYWTDDNHIIGYVDENTPVLVIGVRRGYRRQGIGGRMIEWLVDYALEHSIHQISLSVSKDNHAIDLYRQQGFLEYADRGDAYTMVRSIQT